MSHHHSIRNLLNIKDKNITFDENFCAEELIKGVQSKVFYGQLTLPVNNDLKFPNFNEMKFPIMNV